MLPSSKSFIAILTATATATCLVVLCVTPRVPLILCKHRRDEMKVSFSIRDIIATPGHVKLPYEPVSPISPIKGPRAKKSILPDFLRRERRKSEGYR